MRTQRTYKKGTPQRKNLKRPRSYSIANRKELKYFDNGLSFNVDVTNEVPATGQLSIVGLGDGPTQRDGSRIRPVSIHVKMLCKWGAHTFSSNAGNAIAYFWLVLDRQPNGAAASVTDVLTDAAGVGTDATTALANPQQSKRFKILAAWSEQFDLNGSFVAAGNAAAIHKVSERYVKLPPMQSQFKSSGGTVADLSTNSFFLIAGCMPNADDEIVITGTSRLRFYDV